MNMFQSVAVNTFKIAKKFGLLKDIVYTQQANSDDYDVTTGTPATNTVTVPLEGFPEEYSLEEMSQSQIEITDIKVLIAGSTTPFEPNSNDRFTMSGSTYQVIRATTDPANAVWTLQARKQ